MKKKYEKTRETEKKKNIENEREKEPENTTKRSKN